MNKIFLLIISLQHVVNCITAQEINQLQTKQDSTLGSKAVSNKPQKNSDSTKIEVKWYTIEEAEKLCKVTPKKIMIDIFTDWCGWCKVMDKKTFNHPVIARYLNDNFYAVKFNAESAEPIEFKGQKFINTNPGYRSTHQFAAALLKGQMSYPSIAYFSEKFEYMGAVPGYRGPDEMEAILSFIYSDKYKTISFEEFRKSFTGHIKPQPKE